MALAKGTRVRQVVDPIEGDIKGFQVDQETGELQYLVEWEDAEGNVQSRYFEASEVEAM